MKFHYVLPRMSFFKIPLSFFHNGGLWWWCHHFYNFWKKLLTSPYFLIQMGIFWHCCIHIHYFFRYANFYVKTACIHLVMSLKKWMTSPKLHLCERMRWEWNYHLICWKHVKVHQYSFIYVKQYEIPQRIFIYCHFNIIPIICNFYSYLQSEKQYGNEISLNFTTDELRQNPTIIFP